VVARFGSFTICLLLAALATRSWSEIKLPRNQTPQELNAPGIKRPRIKLPKDSLPAHHGDPRKGLSPSLVQRRQSHASNAFRWN
jgi:hypothetical protein